MKSTIPGKEVFLTGWKFLLSGSIAGIIIFSLLEVLIPWGAPAAQEAAYSVVSSRVLLIHSSGYPIEVAILFSNLISTGVIIAFPYLLEKIEKNHNLNFHIFPKIMLFYIGFVSLGLLSPGILDIYSFIFFLLYLVPHGIFELNAIVFAFTIPSEKHRFNKIPLRRVLIIISFLAIAAFLEAWFSIGFAETIMKDKF